MLASSAVRLIRRCNRRLESLYSFDGQPFVTSHYNGSNSPSITAWTPEVSTPVRKSLTIWWAKDTISNLILHPILLFHHRIFPFCSLFICQTQSQIKPWLFVYFSVGALILALNHNIGRNTANRRIRFIYMLPALPLDR